MAASRFVSGDGCLVFFGMTVPMRWLVFGLLISVIALVLVVAAVVRHVRSQRKPLDLPETLAKQCEEEE